MTTESPFKVSIQEELEKNPKLKQSDLDYLREWVDSQDHLPSNLISDEMILHFLHACYYNVEAVKKTLDFFYLYKTTMPEFFSEWDPSDSALQDVINNLIITAPLPGKDPIGLNLMVCKLNDTNVKKFNYPLCVKWLMMTSLHSIWDLGTQKGYVIIYDATGFSISHCFRISLGLAKNYIDFGKNAAPMRVVKIVFLNTGFVVDKMLTLVKPFLSKELLNMMSFHPDAESYFKDLPPEIVPEDYGGSAPDLVTLHKTFVDAVLLNKEWLMKEEQIKSFPKNGSSKKAKNGKAEKSLDID